MKRMFYVRLNLDEMGGELFRFTDDKSIADWTRGMNVGARGYPPVDGASQAWLSGHAIGLKAHTEAEVFHQQKSELGKAGAQARWMSHAAAMPQPSPSHRSAMPQPSRSQWLSNNQQSSANIEQQETKNHFEVADESAPNKSTRFIPPTVKQVEAYCKERKNGIDPAAFCDHYAAKGWIVGKSKMKDWQAAVRTWERNDHHKPAASKLPKDHPDYEIGRGAEFTATLSANAPTREEFLKMFPNWFDGKEDAK